jgi:hypothetical protein
MRSPQSLSTLPWPAGFESGHAAVWQQAITGETLHGEAVGAVAGGG